MVWLQPRPDRIERAEPGEQRLVDGLRMRPGQRLVEMVMRVDEPRQHDMARGVEDRVDALRRRPAPDPLCDPRALDDEAALRAFGEDRQRVFDPRPHRRSPAMIADGPYWEASRERVNRGRDVPSGQLARRLSRLRGVEGLATRHFRARHSPDCFTRLFSLFPSLFSLLSPFFSLFRGDPRLDNPPKTVCFQRIDQKGPLRAEQDHNREIIRAYQGGNREVTGR